VTADGGAQKLPGLSKGSKRIWDYVKDGVAYEAKNVELLSLGQEMQGGESLMEQITKDWYALNQGLVKRIEWHTFGKVGADVEKALKEVGINLVKH
jgi:hypothetical protein